MGIVHLEAVVLSDQKLATKEFFGALTVILDAALGSIAAAALAIVPAATGGMTTKLAFFTARTAQETRTAEAKRLSRHKRNEQSKEREDKSEAHFDEGDETPLPRLLYLSQTALMVYF